MKLNQKQIDKLNDLLANLEYGSVTIKVNAAANYVDFEVNKRIRISKYNEDKNEEKSDGEEI